MKHADCHVHTFYSGHGTGTVEDMCAMAELKGLETIVFTEHLPVPENLNPQGLIALTNEQEPHYRNEVIAAREAHPSLTVVLGCEADWRSGAEEYLAERMKPYDFSLGSVHMLSDGWCFDDPSELPEWELRGADTIWKAYFDLWFEAVQSNVGFTSMAHPDLPKKFGIYPTFDLKPYYHKAAELARENNVCMEVSTAGLRKPVGEYYPSREFLEICYREGVHCTVGSDAHKPEEIAYDLTGAYDYLRSCGYRELWIPRENGVLERQTL